MTSAKDYGKEYFEGIYASLKKEKDLVLRSFFEVLVREKKGIKKLLDLGCGEGGFLKICQEKGWSGFGIDISAYALKKARKKVKAKFLKADLTKETLPYPDQFFEAVVSFDLVEHLENPDLVLQEARRVLKKDGLLFFTTPNGGYWPAGFFGHFVTDDPTHVNLRDEEYWQKKLKKAGFTKIKVKGCFLFGFPPSMSLRYFLKKLKIPVLRRLIFCPIKGLTSELFIFAGKGG